MPNLAPIFQVNAVTLTTSRAPPVVATIANGNDAVAGTVLDVAGGFDADGTSGSGLESFGLLRHDEGGGAGTEECEACESSEEGGGEHVVG